MVYRNDNQNDGPDDPDRGEPDPEEFDAGEPGPEEPVADDLRIRSEDTYVSDDPDAERYSFFEYPGPSAEDVARSERVAFSGEDTRDSGVQWLKSAGAVLLVFAALGLLISLVGPLAFSRNGPSVDDVFQTARVQQVLDGNTIVVDINGETETVRYIGVSVGVPGESFHRTSRLANQSLVDGEVVILERDVEDRDAEGRLLRYVYVNNQMMNALLVNAGLARYLPDRSNNRHNQVLLAAESNARDGRRGLWTSSDSADDRPA